MSADSSLHVVAECFDIRAPAIVPGQISFEIGQILEKPGPTDDALDFGRRDQLFVIDFSHRGVNDARQFGRPARKIGAVDTIDDSLLRVRDRRSAAIDGVCLEPGELARGDFDGTSVPSMVRVGICRCVATVTAMGFCVVNP